MSDVCCGTPMSWDPNVRGTTQGGLELEGWLVCRTCDRHLIGNASRPIERWKLNKGGRSVDAGVTRIRAEATGDVQAIMQRIARLPDLERALRAIAAGAPNAVELAAAALANGEGR